MSEQISALRRRMIDDMTIRNMSPLTQKAYVRAVKNFSRHFGNPLGDGSNMTWLDTKTESDRLWA